MALARALATLAASCRAIFCSAGVSTANSVSKIIFLFLCEMVGAAGVVHLPTAPVAPRKVWGCNYAPAEARSAFNWVAAAVNIRTWTTCPVSQVQFRVMVPPFTETTTVGCRNSDIVCYLPSSLKWVSAMCRNLQNMPDTRCDRRVRTLGCRIAVAGRPMIAGPHPSSPKSSGGLRRQLWVWVSRFHLRTNELECADFVSAHPCLKPRFLQGTDAPVF